MEDTTRVLEELNKISEKVDRLLVDNEKLRSVVMLEADRRLRLQNDVNRNEKKIVSVEKRLTSVETLAANTNKELIDFLETFKTAMWKILTPPLSALGIILFTIIGVYLWISSS